MTATPASSGRWPNSPGITVVHEVFTGWQQDQGKQQMLDFIATGNPVSGVWTSGIDNVIVDALVESGVPLVPVGRVPTMRASSASWPPSRG